MVASLLTYMHPSYSEAGPSHASPCQACAHGCRRGPDQISCPYPSVITIYLKGQGEGLAMAVQHIRDSPSERDGPEAIMGKFHQPPCIRILTHTHCQTPSRHLLTPSHGRARLWERYGGRGRGDALEIHTGQALGAAVPHSDARRNEACVQDLRRPPGTMPGLLQRLALRLLIDPHLIQQRKGRPVSDRAESGLPPPKPNPSFIDRPALYKGLVSVVTLKIIQFTTRTQCSQPSTPYLYFGMRALLSRSRMTFTAGTTDTWKFAGSAALIGYLYLQDDGTSRRCLNM